MRAEHILIAIHDFSTGGTEHIALRLAGEWVKRGRRVTIIAGSPDGGLVDALPAGVAVVMLDPPVPRSPLSRFRLGRAMARSARSIRPDVIFLPGNFHMILARSFKRWLPDTPVVAKISNPLNRQSRHDLSRPLAMAFVREWTRHIDALAAMSLGLNRDTKRLLPNMPIATILDPFLDDATPVAVRQRHPDTGAPIRLLIVGRLEPQKDVQLAIRTLSELVSRGLDATLAIVGDGSQHRILEDIVSKNNLADRVIFYGYIDDTAAMYRNADLLIISSRYEGGPAVAVEALAHGLPFVATDCSHFLRGLAAYPNTGLLARRATPAALADTIEAALQRPLPEAATIERAVARNRMTRAARSYLNLFDAQLPDRVGAHRSEPL